MTEHTPEPWALCYSGSHIFIVDANYNVIASLDFDSKTKEADATLIAKAPELLEENKRLKERIAELEAAQTWQPNETAPKDREILVCGAGKMWFARWNTDFEHWEGYFTHEPTHWIPLPKMEEE